MAHKIIYTPTKVTPISLQMKFQLNPAEKN